ncbi:MAG: hypothetical protein R3C27_02245 [Hyphomonadaceae bacterium]
MGDDRSASEVSDGEVTIGVVGKYTELKDAYKSLIVKRITAVSLT